MEKGRSEQMIKKVIPKRIPIVKYRNQGETDSDRQKRDRKTEYISSREDKTEKGEERGTVRRSFG